ncbi:MAG: hypothetical protein WCY23_05570 [Candidatus Omnitrophota bacterium]
MKKALVIASVILSFASALEAGEAPQSITTRHKCSDTKGRILWEAAVTITPVAGENGAYMLLEEGKGQYFGFEGETSCRSEMKFTSDKDGIRPAWMKRTVLSGAGNALLEESQDFGRGGDTVRCVIRDPVKNSEKNLSFNYKGGAINKLLTGLYIRAMLEAGERQRTVNIVNDEPAMYRLTMKVVGREMIKVNGSEHEAFKVCIDPNIGLLSPAKVFIPKNYSWFSCEPPHRWLKFKGLETSISSPVVEITTMDD